MIRSAFAACALGIGSLREHPMRTTLSVLGVIIGVATLVAVLSLGDAMQAFVRGELERTTDLQTVVVRARTQELVDGERIPVRNYPIFTMSELRDIAASIPLLRGAAMVLSGEAPVSWSRTGKQRLASVTATTAGADALSNTALAAGRLFSAAEVAHNAPVVVLSWLLARDLAASQAPESMIGELVRVRGLPKQVIGVFASFKGEKGFSARVPFTAASRVFGAGVSLRTPQMLLKAASVEGIPALREAIEDWLATRYRDWKRTVELSSREQQLDQAMQGFEIMKLFLGAMAGISLLVGGIGIMNIMLANVTERTREIGVRKAIGARGQDIYVQFLTEAIAVSIFGSTVGVALGAIITATTVAGISIYTNAVGLSFALSSSTVALAASAAVAIGLVFGTYPARRAARLSPIDAMRHE